MPTASRLNLKAAPWKIANLAALKRDGRLHLPDLQRGFVWSADRVRALHDSLYRSYPVGALLLWEPKWEGEAPFSTRAWDICPARRGHLSRNAGGARCRSSRARCSSSTGSSG